MTHTVSIYFLGRYRPAAFEAPTINQAIAKALEAAAGIDAKDRAKLQLWAAELLASAARGCVSCAAEHGQLGLGWRLGEHDPFLDRTLAHMEPCPGLDYAGAAFDPEHVADPTEALWLRQLAKVQP
jgi:hypothetical protein